jgi:hypothetical protein
MSPVTCGRPTVIDIERDVSSAEGCGDVPFLAKTCKACIIIKHGQHTDAHTPLEDNECITSLLIAFQDFLVSGFRLAIPDT